MFRVGIIINENEASHSKYADTEATLASAIYDCNKNGSKGNSYHFVVYDKFTITKLFDLREDDIATLDGLVIATNALGFGNKLHNTLCANKQRIEEFIDSSKGLFISSQKKLSNGPLSAHEIRSVNFLPEAYDYYVFDRPERSSADGQINIATSSQLLEYPYRIDNQLIDDRCNNNQFMVHKYRSLIIPKHLTSYESLLCDDKSPHISQEALGYFDKERKLMLYSGSTKRVVVATMALDWANHVELLCNILTCITGDEAPLFFVRKSGEESKSAAVDSYMVRANIANIPYREISESELHSSNASAGHVFVFSPTWTSQDIEKVYAAMLRSKKKHFTIHHISNTNVASDKNHKLSKYRNYSSIDIMKEAVVQSLLWNFQATGWRNSVWNYSYVLKLFSMYGIRDENLAKRVYKELVSHASKFNKVTGASEITGSYDSVFNATCKMLEVLNIFDQMYGDSFGLNLPFKIIDVIASAEKWVLEKVEAEKVFDQDICYCLLYLTRFGKFDGLGHSTKSTLVKLFKQLLVKIAEEGSSGRIIGRSSVDLGRLYQTLCALTIEKSIEPAKAIPYLDQIEWILQARQDVHGNWKQISETAEITLMLLEAYGARPFITREFSTADTLISNGVVALQSQYGVRASMWADDTGTTAKAMNAIGLYDKIFNFSINDFFSDIKVHRGYAIGTSDDLTRERIGYFFQVIDDLEKEKESGIRERIKSESEALKIQRRLSKSRSALASALAILVGVVFTFALLVFILYLDHKDILVKMLADWRTVIEGAIAGVIAAVVLSQTFRWLSKRFKE